MQTLDLQLGNVEKSVQKMEDILYHMRNQAAVDRQEVKMQSAMLLAKLSPLFGTAEESSRQGTSTTAQPFYLRNQSTAPAPVAHLDLARARPGLQTEGEWQQLPHTVPTQIVDPPWTVDSREIDCGLRTDSTSAHNHHQTIVTVHGAEVAGSEECQIAAEDQTEVDQMMPIDPDLLVLQQQGHMGSHQAKTGEVRVLQYDGDAASFSI